MHLARTNPRSIVAVFRSVPVKRPLVSVRNKFFNQTLSLDSSNVKSKLKNIPKVAPNTNFSNLVAVRNFSTSQFSHSETKIPKNSMSTSVGVESEQSMDVIKNLIDDAHKKIRSAARIIETDKKREFNAKTLDDTSKRSVVINTLVTDDKFNDVYKSYSKVMDLSKDYSKKVDSILCSKGTLITRSVADGSDLGKVDHLNIVDGNGESWLPVTGLPTEIDWANNDRRTYKEGLYNHDDLSERFKKGYGDRVGEGTHLHIGSFESVIHILKQAFQTAQDREFSTVIAAVKLGSKAHQLLKKIGFDSPEDGDPYKIKTVKYTGGTIENYPMFDKLGSLKSKDGPLFEVPKITDKNGLDITWSYLYISKAKINKIYQEDFTNTNFNDAEFHEHLCEKLGRLAHPEVVHKDGSYH